ncbi:hypothetical protein [Gymnodinialimonas ceratoperidinii]|uniref:Uncharacterized protein n=1 Tax=Gymnodinialimonas ceratoperidinii TaxID=2856823 RepID=A0A8F6TUL6_9RHOB|nr:hypothetical protein [Gymnodinialimonas ceratoperidinii]QXT38148.1 hypothetical protein KYE46_09275 [Gymnodinialimonas ceratoperidinii]
MLDWIAANSSSLQLAISLATAVIWMAYLHILWLNFRRQRQAVILINRSIAQDENAHCFVTNMGAEPIYLMEVMARVKTDDKTYVVKVTEREEIPLEDMDDPLARTNQGPLKSGEFVDIGSFLDILHRADARVGTDGLFHEVQEMEIIVAAADGHAKHLIAASRNFNAEWTDDKPCFVPDTIMTRQIRNFFHRHGIVSMLKEELS